MSMASAERSIVPGTVEDNIIPLPVEVTKKLLSGKEVVGIPPTNLIELSEEMGAAFTRSGALEPSLDPLALVRLVSMSSTLRPLIDAMAVNIHGFGYRFDPVIDLDASDAVDRVRAAMLLEAEHRAEDEAADGEEPGAIDEPTDEEISERIETLRDQQRREKAKLESFFASASREISFSRLSRKMQVDKESTGYGAVEIRRDRRGHLRRMTYAPSWTFRSLPVGKPVTVKTRIRATDISFRHIEEPVRFRRYVQVYENQTRYFKEFGDPRVMSSVTGKYYDDDKKLENNEPGIPPATEVLWFSLDSSESDVYGLVRWSGCIPGVIGSREQAEVNLLFFRSKAIPPMVIMVSGGRLKKGSRERLEELIRNEIKGVENFHKILVIEAEPMGKGQVVAGMGTGDKVKIELRPLTDSIWKDALWQGYATGNRHELGQAFRLPPMLRGDTEKLNRATAEIAREATEQLVFGPERRDFEFEIDRTVLADMGIMLWRFKLNTPESTDAEQIVSFVYRLLDGVVTVNEARRVVSRVLGIELAPLDAEWARMPIKPALAGLAPEPLPEEASEDDEGDDVQPDGDGRGSAPEVVQSTDTGNVIKLRVAADLFNELLSRDGHPSEDDDDYDDDEDDGA